MKAGGSNVALTSGPPARRPFAWRELVGKWEYAALALAVAAAIVSRLLPGSILVPFVTMGMFAAIVCVAVRWVHRWLRHAIWRLRNRLLLSYVFIAVVPVSLLGILGLFSAWAIAGQVGVYLISQEFMQDIDSLRSSADAMLRSVDDKQDPGPSRLQGYLTSRFPGIEILLTRGAADVLRTPSNSRLQHPPDEKLEIANIVLRDGLLYSGVHIHGNGKQVTLLVPITKSYLQRLVQNLGEITLLSWSGSSEQAMRLHEETSGVSSDLLTARSLAPPINFLDLQVLWAAPIPVHNWNRPETPVPAMLSVQTRISQIFRVIFSQKADWDQPYLIALFYLVAVTFLVVELSALITGISITRTMTQALHYLYESTRHVQAGDFSYRIPVKGSDQLAELCHSYNTMAANLDKLLKVAQEKERLQADLDIAKEVQEQLYPRSVPHVDGLQLTALLNPAKSVSGDYYDYQKANRHQCAIVMGDVAGKGISAALLMANIQSVMRAQLRDAQEEGSDICTATMVSQINKHLQANTTTEKYATFFFAVYDERTSELISTNAGHLPPILLRGADVHRLDVNGMVIGVFQQAQYDASRITLQKGDLLLLYTDGITEPENEYGEMFGEERLIETVQRVASKPNEEILREVFAAVQEWTFAPDSADDMTMMIIRRV
ncbi:MAG TPA: SpoIIE family protein phosphatase [Bryobacteraceae bacterium]|nr:SpoIIE family protein phosphatase [Bryobacteraceae bacterium]